MKKFLLFAFAAVMLGFAGCNDDENKDNTPPTLREYEAPVFMYGKTREEVKASVPYAYSGASETGVIWQQLLLFFFPILFGTFFQQLYNAADAVIVGRFVGKEALSAVGGGTGTLIQLLVGFFVGLSSGATVIISQYYGAKRAEMVGYAVHTSIAFSLVAGVGMLIVGVTEAEAEA